jgi:hypothetical protein
MLLLVSRSMLAGMRLSRPPLMLDGLIQLGYTELADARQCSSTQLGPR